MFGIVSEEITDARLGILSADLGNFCVVQICSHNLFLSRAFKKYDFHVDNKLCSQ